MGFSRQEYWSGLPFPSPEDLPDPGIKPRSPALQADALASDPPQNPGRRQYSTFYCCIISTLWIPSLPISLSADEHLGYFHFLAVRNMLP